MTNSSSSTISGRKDEEEGINNKNNIHTFLQRYGTSIHDEETVAAGMVVSQSRLHANVIRSGISKTKGHYRNQRRSSRGSPRGSYPTAFRIDPTGSIVGATATTFCSSSNIDSTTSSFEAEEELDKILSTDIISSSNDSIYPEKTIQQLQPKQQQQQLQKSLEDDSVFDFGSMSSNSKTDPDDSNISPDPILEASRLEDEEDDRSSVVIKLGEPGGSSTSKAKNSQEEDSLCSFLKRSRCTLLALFLGCLMMTGLAFGICLLFLDLPITINSDSSTEESSSTTSSSSSPSSSQEYFNQVGSSLDGIVVEGRFGSSLTLNGNGKRMAVADIEDVYVYDLQVDDVTDVIDWVYTGIINAPPESTVDRNIQFHDVVQNTVQVDMSQDGNHLVVGWPYSRNEDGSELRVGSVQVYQYDDERGWKVVGNVLYGSKSEDYFGASVSISYNGRFVGVGSPGNLGQADVFELVDVNDDEKIWTQYGDITGQLDGSLAVGSISMSSTGQVVAVGGYPYVIRGGGGGEGNDNVDDDGATAVVRIFRFVAGNWIELGLGIAGNFFLEDTAYNAELSANGRIVALSNYYVGEFNPTEDELNDALDVRVFEWVGNAWIQMGGNIHAFEPGDKSGYYASLSNDGKTIFVGDPGRRSSKDGDETGHVHLYEYNDVLQRWEQNRPNVYGEFSGDQFGSAVAMSGDGKHFAASAPYNQGKGIEFGRVYVFEDG